MGIANLNNKLSDLGTDLTCYLGKSFYDEDDYFKGQIASIAFYDCALSSAQVANIEDTVIIPDKDPDVDNPNHDDEPIESEKITLFKGEATAYNWEQAVTLPTTLQNGSFDPANIKSGGNFYVEYSGSKDQIDFILQSWSGGPNWAKVTMTGSGEANNHYYATYSYSSCVSAFGSSDFSNLLDCVHVSAAGKDITVYSVCYDYGK